MIYGVLYHEQSEVLQGGTADDGLSNRSHKSGDSTDKTNLSSTEATGYFSPLRHVFPTLKSGGLPVIAESGNKRPAYVTPMYKRIKNKNKKWKEKENKRKKTKTQERHTFSSPFFFQLLPLATPQGS